MAECQLAVRYLSATFELLCSAVWHSFSLFPRLLLNMLNICLLIVTYLFF